MSSFDANFSPTNGFSIVILNSFDEYLTFVPTFNGLKGNKICLEGYKKVVEGNKIQYDPSNCFLEGNTFRLEGYKKFLEGNKNQDALPIIF